MGLNYDRLKDAKGKPENERILFSGGEFPNCKGLYPDCPEIPSLDESMCRTCHKTDGIKKKRL